MPYFLPIIFLMIFLACFRPGKCFWSWNLLQKSWDVRWMFTMCKFNCVYCISIFIIYFNLFDNLKTISESSTKGQHRATQRGCSACRPK